MTSVITTTINSTVIVNGSDYSITGSGGVIGTAGSNPGGTNTHGNTGNAGVIISQNTLTNAGHIYGGTGSKDSYTNGYGHPGTGGVGLSQSGGVVINTGTITGGAGGYGDTQTPNAAQYGGNGGYGVVITGGTFFNNGTIFGGYGAQVAHYGNESNAARPGTGGNGVSISNGIFVDNGYIYGFNGTAVRAVNATVIMESGASQAGNVIGDSASTLEVGGGTPFVLSHIAPGNQLSGFGHLGFASASGGFGLSGTTLGLANGQIISGMITGDAVTITGFTATSESMASADHLVLRNSGGTTETLDISGFVNAGQFRFTTSAVGTTITALTSTISTQIGGIGLNSGNYGLFLSVTSTGGLTGGAGAAGHDATGALGYEKSPTNGSGGGMALSGGAGAILYNQGNIIGGAGGAGGNDFNNQYHAAATGGAGGAGATGASLSNATITNTGIIAGGAGGAGGKGASDGSDTDQTASTGGAGAGGGVGLVLAGGTAVNDQLITGGAGGSGGTGGYFRGRFSGYGYYGGGNGGAGGTGLNLSGGTGFTNDGTIAGGAAGLGGLNGYRSFIGQRGRAGGGATGTGVYLNGGTLTNAGTISGGTAVQFGATAGTLIVENGAVFNGNIIANAAVTDVLEFAGSSTQFFSGIGTTEQNFKQISFAAGAAWSIGGNAAGLATGEAITGFTSADQLILDGFAATSESLSGGVLTLGNGSTTATLALGAVTDNFAALSDGTNTTISITPASISLGGGAYVITGHAAGLNGTSITGFGQGDTINLEGFAASSSTFVVGTGLVLSNGASTDTLHINGLTTGFFEAISDGTNTKIIDAIPISTITTTISPGIILNTPTYAIPLTIAGSGAVIGTYRQAAITAGLNDTLFNYGILTGGGGTTGQYSYADHTRKGRAGYTGGAGISSTGGIDITNANIIAGGGGGGGNNAPYNNIISGGNGGLGAAGITTAGALTLTNSGTIIGGDGGPGGSSYGGQSGNGGTGAAGVNGGNASTITNTGLIIGGSAGAIGGRRSGSASLGSPGTGGVGISLDGGTLINAGTIAGGSGAAAVLFGAHAATLVIEAGADFVGEVQASTIAPDMLAFADGANFNLGNGFANFAGAEVFSAALVTLAGTLASAVENDGTIDTADGTRLVIDGALTGTGVLINDPSTMVLNGSVSSGQMISFTGTGGVIELGDPSQFNGTLTGFVAGDSLLVDGFTVGSSSFANGQLVLNGSDAASAPESLTINIAGSFASTDFSASTDGSGVTTVTDDIPCFVRGTRIMTSRGEIRVEDLAVGDILPTVLAGKQAIKWIGSRKVDTARHPAPKTAWPVLIRAEAFGQGQPCRDLRVSPGHALYVDGVLIQAEKLINGATVLQTPCEYVEYFHVELESHDVLLAEGLPVESYLDTGNRTAFVNGGTWLDLHPDFSAKHWADTCVPLIFDGPVLQRAKAALLARAEMLGHHTNAEDDLHIMADGKRIDSLITGSTRRIFLLSENSSDIQLRSKTFVPAQRNAHSDDQRRLGICIGRLQFDGTDIALDDKTQFTTGWYGLETKPGHAPQRWTTGNTKLPPNTRLIVLDLATRGHYWAAPEAENMVLCG